MNTYPMKLVTIICEALARPPVEKMLRDVGAHGWTVFDVEGLGSHGERLGDIKEFGNVQFEVIVQPDTADKVLEHLHRDFFPHFAMVAYRSEIEVLRAEKF